MIQFIFIFINFLFILNKTQQINITVPLPSEKNNEPRKLCYITANTTYCSNWAGSKKWTPLKIFMPKN